MDMVDKNSTGFPFSCSNLKPRQTSNRCSINMHSYVPFTYDAVWSMALALKRANKNLTTNFSTSLGHFNYSNAITMDAISYAMKLTNFIGISVSAYWGLGATALYLEMRCVHGVFNALFLR